MFSKLNTEFLHMSVKSSLHLSRLILYKVFSLCLFSYQKWGEVCNL